MAESVATCRRCTETSQRGDETRRRARAGAASTATCSQDLMRVRMVPFGSLQERLYRVVRQSAKEVGSAQSGHQRHVR